VQHVVAILLDIVVFREEIARRIGGIDVRIQVGSAVQHVLMGLNKLLLGPESVHKGSFRLERVSRVLGRRVHFMAQNRRIMG